MDNINKNLSALNKEDTYAMMMMMLYVSMDNPKMSTLSELIYVLDHDSFLKFITLFEGQTIEVPTIQQSTDALRLLMLFQYHKVEKLPWHESLSKANISIDESISAKHKLDKFCNQLESKNYKLSGLLNI